MKLLHALAAVLLVCNVNAQQIVTAEYYFDTDPGVGGGTPLSVTTGDSVLYTGNISSGALPKGFHSLNIRVRNSTGSWSLSERRMFMVHSVAAASYMTAAEYYFDTDPGPGLGTALAVSSGDSITFAGTIPSTGLTDGFHFLSIRAKDNNGHWSLSERRVFFVRTVIAASPLNAAEYFFDTDPGVGNATALSVTGTDSILFAGLIPSASLGTGFHFLNVRARSTNNKWSIVERRMFYIQEAPPASARIVAAEYFVNIDTGLGNCAPIPILAGDSIDFTGNLALSDTSQGNYTLFIRVKDSLENWSAYEARPFIISNGTGIGMPGSADQTRLFQNYPNPFSGSTSIEYYLHLPGDVILSIYDALGRIVFEMRNENSSPGKHLVKISEKDLSVGCYVYSLKTGHFIDTKRMMVIK